MATTVLQMLDEAAIRFADKPYAYRKEDAGWRAFSFPEVRDEARAFAAWLLDRGLGKGDAAALLAEGSPEWIIAEFGLLMTGAVSVPLSIKLLAEEIPFRLSHSGAKAILTTRNQAEKVMDALSAASLASCNLILLDGKSDAVMAAAARFGAISIVGLDEAIAAGRALLGERGPELDRIAATLSEDDVVTICYTSGTTGNPKGIMLTHRNYWTNCADGVALFEDPWFFRTLIILPVDHSFAHTVGIYAALLRGISLYFVDSRGGGIGTLRNIPINLRDVEPDFLLTVPALSGNFMRKIVAGIEEKGGVIESIFKAGIEAGIAWNGNGYERPGFFTRLKAFFPYFLAKGLVFKTVIKTVFGRNIRFCVGGGALLDVKQQEFFAALGLPIFQGYGLTEAAPIISSNTPSRHKFGTSGILAPSIECRIMGEDGKECPQGVVGEIVIRGGNVMKGYYKNPEATAQALRGEWLWTGDLAFMDKDGFLVVVGREKALLIAEDGEKYSPEEIEEAVTGSTDLINQIMVYNDHRKYTTALITLDADRLARWAKARSLSDPASLMSAFKEEFYRYKSDPKAKKVPSAWSPTSFLIIPEAFNEKDRTINSTMKLVRHRVCELYAESIEYLYTQEGSKPENPRNLAAIKALAQL